MHQDRLVKKPAARGIGAYDTANAYLEAEYLPDLKPTLCEGSRASGKLPSAGAVAEELSTIFRLRTEHFVSNDDWVVRHQGRFSAAASTERRWCSCPAARASHRVGTRGRAVGSELSRRASRVWRN